MLRVPIFRDFTLRVLISQSIKKGAQNEAYIKDPDINEFSRFKNVAAVTLAPELGGAVEFIKSRRVPCVDRTYMLHI